MIWFPAKVHPHPDPQLGAVLLFQVQTKLSQGLRCAFPWDIPCGCNQPLQDSLCCVDCTVHCKGAGVGGEDLTKGFGVISAEPY